MSYALQQASSPSASNAATNGNGISTTGESIHEENEQSLSSSSPMTPRPSGLGLSYMHAHWPPRAPRSRTRLPLPPSAWEPGVPWDLCYPPSITSFLDGPHFAYDRTSSFNSDTPVTFESYEDLLVGRDTHSEVNISRNTRDVRTIPDDFKPGDSHRHLVLSQDTFVSLELDFTPGPGHSLSFDALEIPVTPLVKYAVDKKVQQLVSLRIVLVDAVDSMFEPITMWDYDEGNEQALVNFQAERNIIDLREWKAVVRFRLPCYFLDSMHRTGRYRICINLKWYGRQVAFQTLPGIFEVVYVDMKPMESDLYYLKEVTCELPLDQRSHSHHRKYHSDCYTIGASFERIFSLALGSGLNRIPLLFRPNHIPLQDILASQSNRRTLYSLPLVERRRLKDAIQLEYYHVERTLTQARRDTVVLRAEYEIAIYLADLVPIQLLPDELLVLIFSFISDEQHRKIDTLVQTCRRWEQVVSSVWAPLKLATWTPVDEVKAILDGRIGPISVTIDPSSDDTNRPIGSLETERYGALVLAASTSISRWRTLDILSLPNPQQTNSFFGDQSHTIHSVPMNRLRSLSIFIRHDSSRFLDLLLPSIGATTSDQLTNMHLCSVQALLYLAQPPCRQVFNYLTSFKCSLPRTDGIIDILPQFWHLEILDVSGIVFPNYGTDVELPLTKTLRQMSVRAVSIGWMNDREFLQLESCTIVSPPALDIAPHTRFPLCTNLHFEGPRFDGIAKFHIASACVLTLRSPQWSRSRGDEQLSYLSRAMLSEGVLRPVFLHLHLTCSGKQLLRVLHSMPDLKELVLDLDCPIAPDRHFFAEFLPPSLRSKWRYRWADKDETAVQACPSLEVLGLKYRRWFRRGESSDMPALVAMVCLMDKQDRKVQIWVERPTDDQERERIDCTPLSVLSLYPLGLLQPFNGTELPTPSQVADETIKAALAIWDPAPVTLSHRNTMTCLSPSIYSSLFRRLRDFRLYSYIDQSVLLEALAHFEHLEEIDIERLSPPSLQSHTPLLRTLKKMRLGRTSLVWMGGCTFSKLEDLKICKIDEEGYGQFQRVQMPMCKSASFPSNTPSGLPALFDMPQLHSLDLSIPWYQGSTVRPSARQFRLRTTSFSFTDSVALREVFMVLVWPYTLAKGFSKLLNILTKPPTINDFDDHDTRPSGQELPLCPKLKELKLTFVNVEHWRGPEAVHQRNEPMNQRTEIGGVLHRCRLGWSFMDGTDELIGSPYPDMPNAEFASSRQHNPHRAATTGGFTMNGFVDNQSQTKTDNPKMTDLVYSLYTPEKREAALLELFHGLRSYDGLALALWSSPEITAILLKEIIDVYPLLSPLSLNGAASSRVICALALLQCMASHSDTRSGFLMANLSLLVYPFLKTTSEMPHFKYLRLNSLIFIQVLVTPAGNALSTPTDSAQVIEFLLTTEILPLCLRIMRHGGELAKAKAVATFIVNEILLDKMGLNYICATNERLNTVLSVLQIMVQDLVQTRDAKLLNIVVYCYGWLNTNRRARKALAIALPEPLKNGQFDTLLKNEKDTKRRLRSLLLTFYPPRAIRKKE